MKNHGKDLKPATAKQYAILSGEIALAVAEARPSFALMQRLAGNKLAKRRAVVAALKALEMELVPDPLVREQNFWAKLGISVEIDNLAVPEFPADFTEVAIIPEHLTKEQLFALCAKYFPSWKYYGNLDENTTEQSRPDGTYVVGYRGGVEPDLEHRKKSYDIAISEGLIFLNLKERIVAELRYAVPDGIYINRHLDIKGWTTISSLASDGLAFYACWHPDNRRFRVRGYRRSDAGPGYGPREAVFA